MLYSIELRSHVLFQFALTFVGLKPKTFPTFVGMLYSIELRSHFLFQFALTFVGLKPKTFPTFVGMLYSIELHSHFWRAKIRVYPIISIYNPLKKLSCIKSTTSIKLLLSSYFFNCRSAPVPCSSILCT